ncbi:MAG: hypothetical protein IJ066_11695 [Bacteroidaceae bacterium]|nr:hypothetical protein [Bacteroidaceae bacterium]
MTRVYFIETMQSYVQTLTDERKKVRAAMKKNPYDSELHHIDSKIGYAISAIENAIREMQRK